MIENKENVHCSRVENDTATKPCVTRLSVSVLLIGSKCLWLEIGGNTITYGTDV